MTRKTPIEQLKTIENVIYTVPYDNLTPYLQGIRDMINLLNNEEQIGNYLSDHVINGIKEIIDKE